MIDHDEDLKLEALERLSNSVVDLLAAGRLDEAEHGCLELRQRFPDVIDWIRHAAVLHEARGELPRAIEHYRECLAFVDREPDGFDREIRAEFSEAISRLESRCRRCSR